MTKSINYRSKESGLGESPSLWTNNGNLIGVLRTGFESEWEKAEDVNLIT